ncbi:MAG: hypothetical protein JNL57_12985 [Bacteroidetes bacterium]|nr:hypothetical protein [Bacteroidota bacterium]
MAGLCIATESHAQYDETPRAEIWIARVRTTGDSTFEMYVAFWSDTSLIGQRVLVKKRNEPDVLSVSTDTLNYRHIQHIKIARRVKKTDGIIAGALIGSITGAVAGGVYADYQNQQGTNNNNTGPCLGSFFDLMDASSVALGGMVGCGTGCLAGAGIGYYITTA